jgi:hypothetical protein
MSTSSVILQSYLNTFTTNKNEEIRYAEKVDALLKSNKEAKGGGFLTPLNFYLGILENTDKVMFHYMQNDKKDQLLRDLQVAYLLLLSQKKYEQQHQKTENLKTYDSNAKKCAELIDALNYEKVCKDQAKTPAPEYGQATDGYPVKYLGLAWGQWFAKKMTEWMDRKTKTIKEYMVALNEKRLYWVWGSVLLKTVLDVMPADFFNADQAKKTVRTPDLYTGCLSWTLYYFRFSLNLGLLLKHTISGPWMSEEEKSIPWTERFTTQWAQRKFTLLNDSLWGVCNMLTFLWLTGKGLLGTFGDVLTIVLLVFDISVAVWELEEQRTQYNKEMLDYDLAIKQLNEKIRVPKSDSETEEMHKRQMKEYLLQLHALERAQAQCKREWELSKLSLINSLSYAVGLLLAFVLLTAPFFPVAGAALTAIGLAGAVLCFAFTVINNAVKGGIEIYKAQHSVKEAKQDYQIKIDVFKQLMTTNPDLHDNEKKLLFLEIQKLMAETDYQKHMVVLKTMHLIRSILFEALIPALIFVSFVFLPLGIGLGVLGAVIALAILANFTINKLFTPEKEELAEFDDKKYDAFCEEMHKKDSNPAKSISFFKAPKEPSADESTLINSHKDKPDENQPLLDNGVGSFDL